MPLPKFFKTGDYSYGIYLYHQPFLQVILALLPSFAFARHYGAAFTFVAGIPFAIGAAWLSWHFVEKPILLLRKRFSLMSKERGGAGATPSFAGNRNIVIKLGANVERETVQSR
jgi:peptidoglycan/LPS O-acetylase OafA/YrhL